MLGCTTRGISKIYSKRVRCTNYPNSIEGTVTYFDIVYIFISDQKNEKGHTDLLEYKSISHFLCGTLLTNVVGKIFFERVFYEGGH